MKKNINSNNFLKIAYKNGKVLDVKEAFKEFPVQEEWHKGKEEYILNETKEEYNVYQIGDIVFVKEYFYENGANGSNHLFVIVEKDNMAVPIESFGMLISSQLNKLKNKSNKFLKRDKVNGLKKDSIVKTDVIYKITNEQILFKIGKVDKKKIEEYKQSFLDAINYNSSDI